MMLLSGLFVCLASLVLRAESTCVLESDFGFTINCAFKKSGLFRVRNLGGIKAHVGLGFSVGDELGFGQSLTNLDPSRRRSVSIKSGLPPNAIPEPAAVAPSKQEKRGKQNRLVVRQPSPNSPAHAAGSTNMPKMTDIQAAMANLHRRGQAPTTMQPIVVPSGPTVDIPNIRTNTVPKLTIAKPLPMSVPPFRPLPPKVDSTLSVLPISSTRRTPQISQAKGPGLAFTSENQIPRISHDQVSKMVSQMTASHVRVPQHHTSNLVKITPAPIIVENYQPRYTPASQAHIPAFHALPNSMNRFVPMPMAATPVHVSGISVVPAPVFNDHFQMPTAPSMVSQTPSALSFAPSTLATRRQPAPQAYTSSNFVDPEPHRIADHASQLYPVYSQNPTKKLDDYNSITGYGDDSQYGLTKGDLNEKISEIAKAGNISMEAVEAAIVLRQQQLLNQYANIPIPSTSAPTSTSTTELPVYQPEPEFSVTPKQKRYPMASGSAKVMNAPREYYPVGYEKNFDDKFESKVELPETSFYCGDQKYFPGLYADENLGCMVFHVCALTDEGLVMKSFLCPESTLFDQTILKCNWWFYVDCKNSRQLYDTNIPVSKSYQLMKALTFFSSYKKDNLDDGGRAKNPEDIEGIKEAIAILENQDTAKSPVGQTEAVAVQAPPPPPATAARHKTIHLSSGKYNGTIANHRMDRQYEANITRDRPITALDNLPDSDASNSDNHPATVSHNTRTTQSVSVEVTSDESVSSSKERRPRRKQNIYSQRRTQATITTTGKPNAQPTTHEPKILVTSTKAVNTSTLKPGDLVVNSQKAEDHSDNKNEENNMTEQLNVNNTNIGTETVEEIKETGKETVANEVLMANKEKVQIVRPTPFSELVGQFATPTATMAALDEAVLGLAATEGHREPRPNLPSETTVKREWQDST